MSKKKRLHKLTKYLQRGCRYRGAFYDFLGRMKVNGDCEIVAIYKDTKMSWDEITPEQIKEYLAIETLQARRDYLFEIDLFKLKSQSVATQVRIIDENLDAVFLALNDCLAVAGIYVPTEAEKRERMFRQ